MRIEIDLEAKFLVAHEHDATIVWLFSGLIGALLILVLMCVSDHVRGGNAVDGHCIVNNSETDARK